MKGNRVFSFCDFYILLWLIYGLQILFFGKSGTIYSQTIVLLLTIVSLYYTIYAVFHYKLPVYLKGLSVFVAMLTVYGFVLLINPNTYSTTTGNVSNYLYLTGVFNSLLPIFPFYVFARQGKLTRNSMQRWALFFCISVTLQYYLHRQQIVLEAVQGGSQIEEFANNFGYEFLFVIPLLSFFSKKRIIQYLGLAYVMTFILMSMKRGAILIGAVCVVWFLSISIKKTRGGRKAGAVILGIALIIVAYFIVQNLLETSDYFNQRVEYTLEGYSSNRDQLFSTFLSHFLNETNPLRFLFGNGANATLLIMNQYAHNDWLELAINQGFLGLVLYLVYWICFYKTIKQARFDDEIFLAISLLFIINFLRTFFSMSYGDMSVYATSCLGYCMGMISEHEKLEN